MFKPEGMTIPDCKCFKGAKRKEMDLHIDKFSAILSLDTMAFASVTGICSEARDYYLAAILFPIFAIGLKRRKDDKMDAIASYHKEMSELIDRLKPMILQRMEYADTVLDGGAK